MRAKPESQRSDLASIDRQFLWHPFTPMADWLDREPLIIESGQGIWLRDIHGREYYDANSSLWVNVHGHRRPEIDEAVKRQIDQIAHSTMLGLSNPPAIELAERLINIAPAGLERVFYSDSGSEAVEIALKIAYQHWQLREERRRTRYVTLRQAYHGDTIGCVSVGGIETFHSLFRPLLFRSEHARSPSESDGSPLPEILERFGSEIAAVIVEPMVQAAAGMRLMPPGALKTIEQECRRAGVLLIADEVATGFGRTGRMFACEHEDVHPDLMTVAKGLTGGYLPLSATLTTGAVFEPFLSREPDAVFFHGHSYTGNPVGCAAALANLDIFERERTIEQLGPKVERVRTDLRRFKSLGHVLEVRQIGLMVGIELALDPAKVVPYPPSDRLGARVCLQARHYGLITRPLGDVVVFLPPLCSTEAELSEMIDIIYQSIRDVTE